MTDLREARPRHWAVTQSNGNPIDWDGLTKDQQPRQRRGAHTITDDQLYAALEALREHGYRPSKMAEASGLTVKQVRTAYFEGIPARPTCNPPFHGCRPLKEVNDEERIEAQARMVEAEEAARRAAAEERQADLRHQMEMAQVERDSEKAKAQTAAAYEQQKALEEHERAKRRREELQRAAAKAHDDLVESRALRGRSIRSARTNAIALQSAVGQLLAAAIPLTGRVSDLLNDPKWKPTPQGAVKLVRSIAWMTREANQAAQIADDMERRALGEPDQIVAIEGNHSLDQSVAIILEAHAALSRAHERGSVAVPVIDTTAEVVRTGARTLPGTERAADLAGRNAEPEPEPEPTDPPEREDPAPTMDDPPEREDPAPEGTPAARRRRFGRRRPTAPGK